MKIIKLNVKVTSISSKTTKNIGVLILIFLVCFMQLKQIEPRQNVDKMCTRTVKTQHDY